MLIKSLAMALAVGVGFVPLFSPAQVRVTKAVKEVAPLDMSKFQSGPAGAAQLFRRILETDLTRSGWFNLAATGRAEFTVAGSSELAGTTLVVRCETYNALSQEKYISKTYQAAEKETVSLAHGVANDIVYALTGQPGIAGTRIVLVGNRTGSKELYYCDADGRNLNQLTRDRSVSIGPKWGPDGNQLVYTSYRHQFPDLYLINVRTGDRTPIAHYSGLNVSGAISPDGREIALILSKDGNPELYIKDLKRDRLTRLTHTRPAAEASPAWSPDGRQIVFVSDRSGAPQLYLIDRQGGEPQRITSYGAQNVDPDWGPSGFIAYASLVGRQFQIYVLNPATREIKLVSPGDAAYEDPSWAPDGRHIACTRTLNYASRVFIIDTLSPSCISLLPDSEAGDWYSPDWSKNRTANQ